MTDIIYDPFSEYNPSELRGNAYTPFEVGIPTQAQVDMSQMHYGSVNNAPCYSCMRHDEELKKSQMYSAGRIMGVGVGGLAVGALVIGLIVFLMKKGRA